MAGGRLTPRQKMINLMYIVFLAMLALNVSSDVLNGFKQVEDSLSKSNAGAEARNRKLFNKFQSLKDQNPDKAAVWFERAGEVQAQSQQLYDFIEELKVRIVKKADGEKGDVNDIKARDNK